MEERDGRYTGRSDGPFSYREGKPGDARAGRARGLDLGSYAYSDSESDLPMLRAVGHPVAVNPDAGSRAIAAEEGWDVLRFERLGRRLKVGVALAAAMVAGTVAAPNISPWPRPGSPRPESHHGGRVA